MSLTVVGSIAFDAVETYAGRRDRLLGGSAVHFSIASSFLAPTRVVGPVGEDFGDAEYAVLRDRGVDTSDIEQVPGGRTFFWAGRYERDLNTRHTLQTDLNVFEHFEPKLSEASRAADVLFLANIQPDLQRQVRAQCEAARFTALDTMDLWIDITRDSLLQAIASVDCLIVNDGEIKTLTDEPNLVRAANRVLEMGPRVVVAKQGEYGAAMFTRDGFFGLPAYPVSDVVDPTGAGDGARWPTARRWPPSTWRPSAPSAWPPSRWATSRSACASSCASRGSTTRPSPPTERRPRRARHRRRGGMARTPTRPGRPGHGRRRPLS